MKSLSKHLYESFINESDVEVLKSKNVIPLRKVDPISATIAMHSGHEDQNTHDDAASGKKVSIPVKNLKAAQTEIIPEKAIGMAIGMMLSSTPTKIGGDLGSIISGDNFIMDGHHRWAATFLCDPSAHVGGTQINLPGKPLVSVLNIVTAGKYKREGNSGSGNIKDFTSKVIGKLLDDYMINGIPGQFPISADKVKESLARVPGAKDDFEKGKALMMQNADKLPKTIMPGAPDRIDMPVIGPDEVAEVTQLIAKGNIDFTAPYSTEVTNTIK